MFVFFLFVLSFGAAGRADGFPLLGILGLIIVIRRRGFIFVIAIGLGGFGRVDPPFVLWCFVLLVALIGAVATRTTAEASHILLKKAGWTGCFRVVLDGVLLCETAFVGCIICPVVG